MELKVTTFNREIIRKYMEGSSVLEKGIAYYKHANPTISNDQAKELAIREAQDRSYSIWANDSTGYIRNEAMAFSEFKEYVDKGRYFSIASYNRASDFGGTLDWIGSIIKKVFLWWCVIAVSGFIVCFILFLMGVL